MPARTVTYYDSDNNVLTYGGAMAPAAYFEQSTGLAAGRFIKGRGYMYGYRANGTKAAVARVVSFKNNRPSLHKCGPRCRNAQGPNCECSCRGEFHGVDG